MTTAPETTPAAIGAAGAGAGRWRRPALGPAGLRRLAAAVASRRTSLRRLAAAAAAAAIAAVGGATAPPAHADGSTRVVCSWRVPLYETPGGLVVGSVTRGDRVDVLKRGRTPWIRVRTDFGTRGWLRRGVLC